MRNILSPPTLLAVLEKRGGKISTGRSLRGRWADRTVFCGGIMPPSNAKSTAFRRPPGPFSF